jgi:hypothetical protein
MKEQIIAIIFTIAIIAIIVTAVIIVGGVGIESSKNRPTIGNINFNCKVCGTLIDNNSHITTNGFNDPFVCCPKCGAEYEVNPIQQKEKN